MPRGLWKAGESLPDTGRHPHDAVGTCAPDPTILSVSLELVDQALSGLALPRAAYAELVCELYEGVAMGMPYKELMAFARLSAASATPAPDIAPEAPRKE